MQAIRDAIYETVKADQPMTVRQCFYLLVVAAVIAKTEAEYKRTVVRLLTEMRLDGTIPFHWIADNSRWMRKPRTYSSLRDMLELTAETYRRALWAEQNVYVELWLEKEALAGVIYEVTRRFDVPLMVTRGYPSLTFVHEAAQSLADEDRPIFIYYLGDHDPSGLDIERNVEQRLRQFAPDADLTFSRLAVTPEQVLEMDLPTRPTKATDTRAKGFTGASVEVDAIPPAALRRLATEAICRHIDPDQLRKTHAAEESELALLQNWDDLIAQLGQDGA